MKFRDAHGATTWRAKTLCRRYGHVHFTNFRLLTRATGAPGLQMWWWALGMFAPGKFEILGAWPAGAGAVEEIANDLRSGGVLSIRGMSIGPGVGADSSACLQSRAKALRSPEPRVLEVIHAQSLSGDCMEGVAAAAIRSALQATGRIHDGLVRRSQALSPFADAAAASDFVADWLQRADARLYEARRPRRPVPPNAA